MATVVCQGLQSCLESQLVESRMLRLRLSAPKSHFSRSLELALKPCLVDSNTRGLVSEKCHYEETSSLHKSPTPDMGGWSFLQALSSTISPQGPKESMEEQSVYVHPLVKRSSSTLSDKSLELCTENLGSETGTDITDDSIFSLLATSDPKTGDSPTREQQIIQKPTRQLWGTEKASPRGFPPPLTTMTGSESLQFRTHREEGRLIMKAIKAPSRDTFFQAERSHGRLRLRFVKDSAPNFDPWSVASTEENESGNKAEEAENDMSDDEAVEEEGGGEETEENFEDDDEEEEAEEAWKSQCCGEDVDGNISDIGGEMGIEEFPRSRRRCKDGELENKGLLNWEPRWVVTS